MRGAAVSRPVAGLVERPRLFAMLEQGTSGPVTLLCAPAGSGKTMLLSSWLRGAPPAGAVAWVGVERGEQDATRFWGAVIEALRDAGAVASGDPLATLAPAPLGTHDELVAHLLDGIGRFPGPVLLIVDDLHELRSPEALRGLERLLARMPAQLHLILVSRHDPKLGLHRLRLTGELVEIRAADLEFTAGEADALIRSAGVAVARGALERLHARTEGWAAGLRLAAMSLARHDEPDRFVDEFSGTERTVADYLLGEVLATQPPEVRRLLLRSSILERVSGELADVLTGGSDGARVLGELEEANAFVAALDVGRSWFRCHQLLADLLRLELRRETPELIPELHRRAAAWHAAHGHGLEAIRHAQLGSDWDLAGELLARHWTHLLLDGEEATLGALLDALPSGLADEDAELATIAAADRLAQGRWAEADALVAAARAAIPALPAARRRRTHTALAAVELFRARRLGGLETAVDGAGTLLAGDAPDAAPELRALALMNLGIAEAWTLRLADADAHLTEALALGRATGRPYVEVGCLGALGVVAYMTHQLDLCERRLREAVTIAERMGWAADPIVGPASSTLGTVLIDRGRLTEGAGWLERADPILTGSPEPAAIVGLRHAQGMLAYCRGEFAAALDAFRDGARLAHQLRAPHFLAAVERQWELRAALALGDAGPAEAALADAGPEAGAAAAWCNLAGRLALADGDPAAAAAAVAPVLDGRAFVVHVNQEIEALLLDGVARLRLGEDDGAERSAERALDLAEPQGRVWIVLTVPGVHDLLAAHPVHRTGHAAHLATLLDHLAGTEPARAAPDALSEPLSERELAVLRFLPTNLSAAEIGGELFLSVHTVKTHMRKLYAKLDVHTRAEAVQRGRALGLLAPGRGG